MKKQISLVEFLLADHGWSRTGLIFCAIYGLFALYLLLRIVGCAPEYIRCGQTWFVLSLPLSLTILPFFGRLTPSMYLGSFFVSSLFYLITLYQVGRMVEFLRGRGW